MILPLISLSAKTLFKRDLIPYKNLSSEAGSVMLAHLDVPALSRGDSAVSSLSSNIIALLRQMMGPKGLAVTDALDMGGATQKRRGENAGIAALLAGADVLLVPRNPAALMRRLNQEVRSNSKIAHAAHEALARLDAAFPRRRGSEPSQSRPSLSVIGCAAHQKTAEAMARAALTWARGAPSADSWRLPRRVRYWEPEERSPARHLGRTFVNVLRDQGVSVAIGPRAQNEETLVIGSFLGPRAYTGRIAYGAHEAHAISACAQRAKSAILVSFGSPFVFEQIPARGLCAWTKSAAGQKAAALALAGKIPAPGRMPVRLRAAARY